jgi:hypothetical protein
MPRSRALRLLGGALVSAALPQFRTTRASAAAWRNQDCGGPGACPGKTVCGLPFLEGCTEACCGGDEICCKWKGYVGVVPQGGLRGNCSQSPAGLVCCCPREAKCGGPPGKPVCLCRNPCGPGLRECCKPEEDCTHNAKHEGNPEKGICCKRGHSGCGTGGRATHCCPPGSQCCLETGKCCPPGTRCCQHKEACCYELTQDCDCNCKAGNTVKCGSDCCHPKLHKCCPGTAGAPKHCAPKNATCCGVSYCTAAAPTCCDGKCIRGDCPGVV